MALLHSFSVDALNRQDKFPTFLLRGISSVGRALAWHARGQEFDSPMLHHSSVKKTQPSLQQLRAQDRPLRTNNDILRVLCYYVPASMLDLLVNCLGK